MSRPTPLDDARTLLAFIRVLYRARVAASATGVQPAARAAQQLQAQGRALAAAVEAAEQLPEGPDRIRALAEVARIGELVWQSVDDQWEGIRGLLEVLIAGTRGETPRPGILRDPK